jgi:hypothetical protein
MRQAPIRLPDPKPPLTYNYKLQYDYCEMRYAPGTMELPVDKMRISPRSRSQI